MKLDDRLMTVFTALLLLVGIGAILQRGENGTSIFGGDDSYVGNPDKFALRAGRVQSLDVLLNDQNATEVDTAGLQITTEPSCGTALVVGGAIQYSDSASCAGEVELSYCVPFEDACDPVDVALTIVPDDSVLSVGSNDGAPTIVFSVSQGMAPEEQTPQVAMARPMRLTLPSSSEVITPGEATAEVRRIGEAAPMAVAVATDVGRPVNVSRDSARTGSVGITGTSLSAPAPSQEDAGIQIAAGSDASPQSAPARPSGLSPLSPQGFSPTAIAPQSPASPSSPQLADGPDAQDDAPLTEITQLPGGGVTTPGVTTPQVPTAPGAAPTAGLPQVDIADSAPAVGGGDDSFTVSALPQPTSPAPQPSPVAPAAQAPQAPAVDVAAAPAPVSAPEVAPIEAAPEVDVVETTPDVQVAEPAAQDTPIATPSEDSGVLASLARSNTVFGATVSAAKALFGPSEAPIEVNRTPSGTSAPRPRESRVIAELDGGEIEIDESLPTLSVGSGDSRPVRPGAQAPLIIASLDDGSDTFVPRTAIAQPQVEAPTIDLTEDDVAADTGAADEPAEAGEQVAALPSDADTDAQPPVSLNLPAIAPDVAAADCGIDLSLQVEAGAELIGSLSSSCRPSQQFLVEHSGLTFTADTDANGVASFIVPALVTNAIVRVSFPDGETAVDRATVEGMSNMTRVGVVWTDEMDFLLGASEFGARPGSPDYVSAENTRDYRLARRSGGGYLTALGPADGAGVRAQVYTIFQTIRTDNGVIDFDFKVADPTNCAPAPVVRVLRSEGAELVRNSDLQLDLSTCDVEQALDVGFGLRDIRIAETQ